jgi:hypothetical protein
VPTPPGPEPTALFAECARRSAVCWLSWEQEGSAGRPGTRDRLVWHAWYDGAVLVVDGDGAQCLPGLAAASAATATMRSKDTGGRVLGCAVAVHVVAPDDPEWEAQARALLAVRLNAPDAEATLEAWRTRATVLRLVPRPAVVPAR